MTTLKEAAEAYSSSQFKNIVELEAVSTQQEIKREVRKNKDNEEYEVAFVTVANEDYRVPNSVLEQLQAIMLAKPDLKTFKVTKKGEGLNTSYTVIQLE